MPWHQNGHLPQFKPWEGAVYSGVWVSWAGGHKKYLTKENRYKLMLSIKEMQKERQ